MDFPRHTHPLHFLEEDDGSLLVADLAECRLLEINPCVRDILELAPTAESEDAVKAALAGKYDAEDIAESLEALEEIAEGRLLFATDEEAAYPLFDKQRPRYYIPQERELWYSDIKNMSAGTNISLYYQAKALSKHVDLHFAGTKFEKIDEGIYEVPLSLGEVIARPWKFEQYDYDAVLFLHMPARNDYLPLYRTVDVPIIMQNHGPRGHGGEATNSLLLHYSIMRDYDAITAPSDYVREYMSEFVLQPEMFRTLPNGVDHDLFQPMDKDEAKRIVAELSGRPEVMDRPTVGFLSRIQPEKGATVFFRIAERIPEAAFIVTGKGIERYEGSLPKNVVYVPFQPRDMLPVIYNAFDVYCFPAMSGEETFGMTLLEAMACGVPPVVTDFDGLPSVAGDAGIIVPAHNLDRDMGSFASFAPVEAMAEQVRWLIEHEDEREALGEKAYQRAQTFTWDITARHVVEMARECRETQRLTRRGDITVRFTTAMDWTDGQIKTQALLLNCNENGENVTQCARYPLRIDEAIGISLMRDHTAREVEAALKRPGTDPTRAGESTRRVVELLDQIAVSPRVGNDEQDEGRGTGSELSGSRSIRFFEDRGRGYVADSSTGHAVPVDDATRRALSSAGGDAAAALRRDGSPEARRARTRVQVLKDRGVLRAPEAGARPSDAPRGRPRLFVPSRFLAPRERTDPLVSRNHYHLLTALAERADLYMPMQPGDEAEDAFDFGELGIHMLSVADGDADHPLKWIPRDMDAILLLKPFGNNSDHEWLFVEAGIPVVARFEASWTTTRRVVETVVNSVGLAKPSDAVCLTSSWARRWFSERLPRSDHLHSIPAAPVSASPTMEAGAEREAVTRLLEWDEIGSRPLVGFLTSGEGRQLASITQLARLRPDWAFLVVGVGRALGAGQETPNLRGFPAFTNDDLAALPTVFSAMDALCFATDLGTPAELVLEAAAVGTPLVAVGGEQPPVEIGDEGRHVPAEIDAFGSVSIPVEALEGVLNEALGASVDEGSEKGVGALVVPSWQDIADETLRLLRHGGSPRVSTRDRSGSFPPVLTQMLTPHSAGTRSATFDMADGTLRPIDHGVLRALERRHADVELELIRERTDHDFERE